MPTDVPPTEIFPQRLKSARLLRGYSQEQLAERAGMPPSSIAHFETGTRKPSFESLRKLAIALEITTDYLLGTVDQPELSKESDPLYRDFGKITGHDREIAKDFLKMLAERKAGKKDKDP